MNYPIHRLTLKNYSPFGTVLYGRSWSSDVYRYGFNGQEKEKEITGSETHTSAEFWMYDSRLARRWDIDPLYFIYFDQTPYAVFNNCPILVNDRFGLTGEPTTDKVIKGEGPMAVAKRNGITLDQLAKNNPSVFKNYEQTKDKKAYWANKEKNWMIHPDQDLIVSGPEIKESTPLGEITVSSDGVISNAGTGEITNEYYKGIAQAKFDGIIVPKDIAQQDLYWVQTVESNLDINSHWKYPLPPLQNCQFLDIFTGFSDDYNHEGKENIIGDIMGRPTHPDGRVTWYATTSLVRMNKDIIEVILTVRWGFYLDSDGTGEITKNQKLCKADVSGTFHENKIQDCWFYLIYGTIDKTRKCD